MLSATHPPIGLRAQTERALSSQNTRTLGTVRSLDTQTRPPISRHFPWFPGLCLRIDDNEEVFDLRAWTAGHLKEHIPWLTRALLSTAGDPCWFLPTGGVLCWVTQGRCALPRPHTS